MNNKKFTFRFQCLCRHLSRYLALVLAAFAAAPPALASTRIRGEFEYNLDNQTLSEWQVGPVFSLDSADALEVEIPLGQDQVIWFTQPELTYEIDLQDVSLELNIGLEVPFDNNTPVQPFGSLEGSVVF